MTDRLVSNVKKEADAFEATIRPQSLDEFIGQEQARANLKIFIQAAKSRGDALDHVLFAGPPGLGKTTLAQIMAKELGVSFRATSGPVISKAGDLAALLTNLEERDVLFIDEIHRFNPAVRRSSIRRWRTFSSISSSAKARPHARSASICRSSPSSAPPPAPAC